MYPLTPVDAVVLTRNHQGVINAVEKFEGRKYDYEPMNDIEAGYVYKLTPTAIETDPPAGVAVGAPRHVHQAGLAARRPQVADPRQRGLHATLPPQMRSNQAGGLVGDHRRHHPRSVRRRQQHARGPRAVLRRPRHAVANCRTCSTPPIATTRRSTRSIRAGWRSASSTSPKHLDAAPASRTSTRRIDTLRVLAENTDGRAIVNRNDLAAGMKQIIRDSSAYYLVGYNSTQAPQGRQVPRDQGAGEAAGRAGARPRGLLGLHRR